MISGGGRGLSRAIAEHVAGATFDQLPARVVRATELAILDAVGVSLGASGLGEGCQAFIELAVAQGGAGPCAVLGAGCRLSPQAAALANGSLAHALDFEDAHDAALVHPHAAPVAAGLAVAQYLAARAARAGAPPLSGARLVTAVAVGGDLTCRLGFALSEPAAARGWYPPPILGALGAAATVASLLGLPPARVLDALSLAACQATCSGELKRSPHSLIRSVRDAFGAQAAVTAGLLAAGGVSGFARPLDGEAGILALYGGPAADPAPLADGLGTVFHGGDVSFKPWPSCRGTHAFVDGALRLRESIGTVPVAAARLRGAPVNSMLAEPRSQKVRPATAIEAKFSLPFTVASALLRGHLDLDCFSPAALRDPAVSALAQRVTFQPDPAGGTGATWGQVTVRMADGATVECLVDDPPGSPGRPLGEAALLAKFADCARHAACPPSSAQTAGLATALLGLARAADVATVTDLLSPPRAGRDPVRKPS